MEHEVLRRVTRRSLELFLTAAKDPDTLLAIALEPSDGVRDLCSEHVRGIAAVERTLELDTLCIPGAGVFEPPEHRVRRGEYPQQL